MNIEARAMESARLTFESRRELSLDVLGENDCIRASETAFLAEDGGLVRCVTRKFISLQQIKEKLTQPGKFYLYKLHELDKYGFDLQPTGEKYYHLRYAQRAET